MNIPVDTAFRGQWIPLGPLDFGNITLGETSGISARIGGSVDDGGEVTGGTPPYTVLSIEFVGGAPAAEITLTKTTTTLTDDTIQITTGLNTPTGPYGGTIRAVVIDSSAAVQVLQLDLIYTFTAENPGENEGESAVFSLNPSHYWPMRERIGPVWRDLAGLTPLDLSAQVGQAFNDYNVALPGPTRGSPREPCCWFARSGERYAINTTGVAVNGWTTGVISMWVWCNEIITQAETTFYAQQSNNNSGLWGGLGVTSAGVPFAEVTWNNNPRIRRDAVGGTDINDGKWHHLCCIQRADGMGLRLFVDGVDVSGAQTLAGIATTDSWFDDVFTSPSNQDITIPGLDGFQHRRTAVAQVSVWRNRVITDSDVLAIFNATNKAALQDPVDYMDAVQKLVIDPAPLSFKYWLFSGQQNDGDMIPDQGYIENASFDDFSRQSGFQTAPSGVGEVAAYPISGYNARRAFNYGSNEPTLFTGLGDFRSRTPANDDTATINIWCKVNDIGIVPQTQRLYFGLGQTTQRFVNCGIEADRLFCEVSFNSGVDSYRRQVDVLAAQQFRVQVGNWYMLTVTQRSDGTGFHLYVNGVLVTDSDATDVFSGAGGLDYWLRDIGGESQWNLRIGGRQGSQSIDNFEPNLLSEWIYTENPLSDADVLALYNAGIETTPSFDAEMANYTFRHDYRFEDTASPITDSGTYGSSGDAIDNGGPATYDVAGYQPADADARAAISGLTQRWIQSIPGAAYWGTAAQGTFILLLHPNDLTENVGIWTCSNASQFSDGIRMVFFSNDVISVAVHGTNTSDFLQVTATIPGKLKLDAWHLVVFVQRNDGAGIQVWWDGVNLDAVSIMRNNINGAADINYWMGDVGQTNLDLVINGDASQALQPFNGKIIYDRLAYTETALTDQQIQDLAVAAGVDIFVLPDTLHAKFHSDQPEHLYTWIEASGVRLDRGRRTQGDAVVLSVVGSDPSNQEREPTFDTNSIDMSASGNWLRNTGLTLRGGSTGTILMFVTFTTAASSQTWVSVDSANETNNLAFGWGARGVNGGAYFGQLSCVALGGSFTDYRAWVADDDLTTLGVVNDGLFHLVSFQQSGSGVTIQLDGVQLAVTEVSGGSPPGSGVWFENLISPTRTTFGNGRNTTTSENAGDTFGWMAVYRNDVLSLTRLLDYASKV